MFRPWRRSRFTLGPLLIQRMGLRFRQKEDDGGGGDGSGGGGGGGGDGSGGDGEGGGSGGGGDQNFTQEQVNSMMKKERAKIESKFKEQTQKQLSEINKLRESKDLTEAQRKKLDDRADTLQAELMTEKERAEADKKAAETKHGKELKVAQGESVAWQGRYENQMKETDILAAASKHAAYNAVQLLGLVAPLTHVVSVKTDKGEETGKFTTVVKTAVKNEDDAFVEKSLTVDEYVDYLKGQKEFQNLFVSQRAGGTGHRKGTGSGGGSEDLSPTEKIERGLREQKAARTG